MNLHCNKQLFLSAYSLKQYLHSIMLYNKSRLLTSSLCACDHAGIDVTSVPELPEPMTHRSVLMFMS